MCVCSESDFTLNWSNVFLLLKYLEFIQIFCMIVGETFLCVASQIPLVSNKEVESSEFRFIVCLQLC